MIDHWGFYWVCFVFSVLISNISTIMWGAGGDLSPRFLTIKHFKILMILLEKTQNFRVQKSRQQNLADVSGDQSANDQTRA